MRGTAREGLLAQTFVDLIDILVDDFDVVDPLTLLADRAVEVLGVTAAGLMLVSGTGKLEEVASSSDSVRLVELFELQSEEGPSLDMYCHQKAPVNPHLTTIGAFSLFHTDDCAMADSDLMAAQALDDVATISILHYRNVCGAQLMNEQLNHALTSRAVIEQAKGVLVGPLGLDTQQAFSRLRHYARNHNRRLLDVSQDLVGDALRSRDFDRAPQPGTTPSDRGIDQGSSSS